MKTTNKPDTIRLTVKGQVVIPSWLRKEFEIEEGTRGLVYQEGDAIKIGWLRYALRHVTIASQTFPRVDRSSGEQVSIPIASKRILNRKYQYDAC